MSKISGRVYLLVAIAIFAASSSVGSKLAGIGMDNLVDGRNPISFCNVLFIGNLCALLVLTAVYGREWRWSSFTTLSPLNWLILIAVAIVSGALAPSLTFLALENTNASNVVLIGRIQSPLTFAFLSLILGRKGNRWMFVGELLSVAGIILILILQSSPANTVEMMGLSFGKGELLAIGGAVAISVANLTRKARLDQIPIGVFTIFRLAVGTIVFWGLTLKLYGSEHFADAFVPFVWQWISIYGVFIVAGGQIIWFKGLKMSNFASISYAGYLTPIAGILAAFLILGEVPTAAQYIGGSVILLGAFFNQVGIWQETKNFPSRKLNLERFIGFKGI
ncbi:MAG: DMT family transporter [Cyanobacteria bacterium P01_C01_bin.72]